MNLLKAGLSTTKMCFVASTLVLCHVEGAARLEPMGGLESLAGAHPELKVWARDEFMGEEGWKRPIAWFTTHPEELFTLGVDSDGDGETDEELTGTGEHPFWVEDHRAFVPMRDLRPGMRLALAQKGKVAIVTGNVSKRGPPGESFTTYNFEVEDFHTYFVGEAGIWVHNTGTGWCEEVFSVFHAVDEQFKDLWESYDWMVKNPPARFAQTKPTRWQLRMFNDVRRRYFGGEAGGFKPPWNDGARRAGQTLGQPRHPTSTLAANMERVFGTPKPGTQFTPHHIVSTVTSPNAPPALREASDRAIAVLNKYGIDINDASNGVFLPNRNAAGDAIDWDLYGPRHRGSHPQSYLDEIAQRLENADAGGASADDIRDALQKAAFDIVEGNLPVHIIP